MRKLFLFGLIVANFSVSVSCQAVHRGFNKYSNVIGKANQLYELDTVLAESSALCFWNDIFWSLNDSGGQPCLYGVDKQNGSLRHIIHITNSKNIDWEALTQDDRYFYIGDFGNNNGNRKDLKVLKVRKPDILNCKEINLQAEFISFHYPDQSTFEVRKHKNKWDCESMVYQNDSLFLITKNWLTGFSSIYALPTLSGNYVALKKAVFNADGLVTDAALSADGKTLYLVGYRDYVPYISVISNYSASNLKKSNVKRFEFSALLATQTEGICFIENNLYFSCEKSKVNPASVFIVKR
jgi:hypothetical protein